MQKRYRLLFAIAMLLCVLFLLVPEEMRSMDASPIALQKRNGAFREESIGTDEKIYPYFPTICQNETTVFIAVQDQIFALEKSSLLCQRIYQPAFRPGSMRSPVRILSVACTERAVWALESHSDDYDIIQIDLSTLFPKQVKRIRSGQDTMFMDLYRRGFLGEPLAPAPRSLLYVNRTLYLIDREGRLQKSGSFFPPLWQKPFSIEDGVVASDSSHVYYSDSLYRLRSLDLSSGQSELLTQVPVLDSAIDERYLFYSDGMNLCLEDRQTKAKHIFRLLGSSQLAICSDWLVFHHDQKQSVQAMSIGNPSELYTITTRDGIFFPLLEDRSPRILFVFQKDMAGAVEANESLSSHEKLNDVQVDFCIYDLQAHRMQEVDTAVPQEVEE